MKRKILKPTCRYCTFFAEAKNRTVKSGRECIHNKKYVFTNSGICDKFELHNHFWCNRNEHWMNIYACKAKSENKSYGCTTCKQGKLIKRMIKKYNKQGDKYA